MLVPLIVVAAGALQKPRPPDPGDPPFVTHVSQNGLLVMLSALFALASFLLPHHRRHGRRLVGGERGRERHAQDLAVAPREPHGRAAHQVGDGRRYAAGRRGSGGRWSRWSPGALAFGLHPLVTLSGTTLGASHALALIGVAYLLVVAGAVCSLTIALSSRRSPTRA